MHVCHIAYDIGAWFLSVAEYQHIAYDIDAWFLSVAEYQHMSMRCW